MEYVGIGRNMKEKSGIGIRWNMVKYEDIGWNMME